MTLYTIQLLDRVQRRAALICTGAYRHTETQTLLRELSWLPLKTRRHQHKLITFYKIYKHIYPNYLFNLIPPLNVTHYNLRRSNELRLPNNRLQSSNNSFFPATAKVWNNLPPPVKNLPTVSSFKNKISIHLPKNPYHTLCSGKQGIWLCRLRLGLSALNYHRFTYNLTSNPFCPHCGNLNETTMHFLFHCHSYDNARQTLFNSLADLGIDTTDPTALLQVILHGTDYLNVAETLLTHIYNYLSTTNRFI